ncbi:hypothetical protein [Acinetobacter guillouiae]|uniref:hypothetical protein n=2 Tax=Acinetobacter TaxID=469 RepID=UPI003AF81DEB
MNFLKFSYITILIVLTSSCVNSEITQDARFFKTITHKYFKNYDPDEYVSIDKPENKYSIVKIQKSKLSLVEYNQVHSKLKKDGWRMISNKDHFYEYCLEEKIYLGALFPEKDKYYSFIGHEVMPSSKNSWIIFLDYGEGKVNDCRKK